MSHLRNIQIFGFRGRLVIFARLKVKCISKFSFRPMFRGIGFHFRIIFNFFIAFEQSSDSDIITKLMHTPSRYHILSMLTSNLPKFPKKYNCRINIYKCKNLIFAILFIVSVICKQIKFAGYF